MPPVSVLHPYFTWHTAPTVDQLRTRLASAPKTPCLRGVAPQWIQRIVGFLHFRLKYVSTWYCRWYGIPCPGQIWPLPFGLLLKHSDGTRIEEVITTRAAYDAGIPVPIIISYGTHDQYRLAPVSILMTRLPGEALFCKLWEWYEPEEKRTMMLGLKEILRFIRSWGRHPSAETALICSIRGTPIRSVNVPFQLMPPCADEAEFNRQPMRLPDRSVDDYEDRMASVEVLHSRKHEVCFTHGDLGPDNILVTGDGRISGLIDWETAGYYPEYWEYTTAWQDVENRWFYDIVDELADGKYQEERPAAANRWELTNCTMFWL